MKRWQGLLLGLVISVVALYLALRSVNLSDAIAALAGADYIWVLPAFALSVVGLFTRAIRWRALLDGRIPLNRSFSILNISYIVNNILPARLGEVARAFLATRVEPPIPVFTSLSTIFAERIIDMLMVVVMLGGALLALPDMPPEVTGIGMTMGVAALVIFVLLVVFARQRDWAHALLNLVLRIAPFLERLNLGGLLDRVLDGLKPLGAARGLLAVAFWTVVSWTFSVIAGYVLMYTLYDNPRWDAAVLFIALASVAIAVPATFASVGPFEYSVMVGLVAVYGAGADDPRAQATALSFALILHALNVTTYAIMGAIGLVQEGVSLGQVARGARQIDASQQPRVEALPEN
ncbi:MAG: lysylphosphatidylglycerol synthase transmembrane domain-containing protein [Anaerolineae bacterium]